MSFELFYNNILTKTTLSKKIEVFGKTKDIVGMASYRTVNKLEYTKIVMDDKSFLYIVPADKEVYYSVEYIVDTLILDDDIGNKEIIIYNGEKYKLENKDDYQYVTCLHIGNIDTIEGECIFSDYVPDEGDDFLSLGWIVSSEERADINPSLISIEDVKII